LRHSQTYNINWFDNNKCFDIVIKWNFWGLGQAAVYGIWSISETGGQKIESQEVKKSDQNYFVQEIKTFTKLFKWSKFALFEVIKILQPQVRSRGWESKKTYFLFWISWMIIVASKLFLRLKVFIYLSL